jgi:hypothetical protein
VLTLLTAPVRASLRSPSDTALARASAAAVRGIVTEVFAERDAAVDAIYTFVTIEVSRSWGFPAPPARVQLKLLGGAVDGAALVIEGQARFTPGEEVITLLDVRPRDHSLSVTGLESGKWTVSATGAAEPVVSRALGIDVASPARTARTARDLEALVSLAGTSVRLPAPWAADRIEVARPHAPTQMQDALSAGAARWHEADWGAPVFVDSQGGGHTLFPGGGFAQLRRAIAAWSGPSALRLQPGVLRGPRCFAGSEPADGRVSVSYDDPCDEIADTSPTIALGGVFYDTSDVRVVQGMAYGRITRGIVVLDNVPVKFAGFSTGCYEEVLTHEIGHAVGLSHTAVPQSVMYPWLAPECVNRLESQPLQTADVAALVARYPDSAPAESAPGIPGGLTAQVSGSTVTVSWMPATGAAATAYQLQAGRVPGGGDVGVATTGATTFVATDVARGVYYVRIVAVNAYGASAPSADVVIVVGDGLPGTPVGLLAAAGPAGSVRVLWQPPPGGAPPDGYTLLVGTAPGHPTARIQTVAPSLITSGVASGTYYVRAVGVNRAGAGPASAEITVVVP